MTVSKFYGISLGPGDPELVSLKALNKLQQADIIYSATSRQGNNSVAAGIISKLPDVNAEKCELIFAMNCDWNDRLCTIKEHAVKIAESIKIGKKCTFATIGDALTYSTFTYLAEALKSILPDIKVEVIPGINSWSALNAQNGYASLVEDNEKLIVFPAYQQPDSVEIKKYLTAGNTVVLLKTYRSRNHIIDQIKNFGAHITYGSNSGLENQFISSDLNEIYARPNEYLSMLILKSRKNEEICNGF